MTEQILATTALWLLLALAVTPLTIFAQATQRAKPEAAVARLGALGNVSDGEKSVIRNSLHSELSNSYRLVAQQEYDQAEELAFRELNADQCTEEQCIRKIQEILQVERLFFLQVIREGGFAQLSLTLARATDRFVKADSCRDCDIGQLNDKVAALVAAAVRDDLGTAPPVPASPHPVAVQPAPPGSDESAGLGWWRAKWIASLSLALLAAGYGYTEAAAVTDSNQTQQDLLNELKDSENMPLAAYNLKVVALKDAQAAAKSHVQNAQTGYAAALALAGVAAWIYFDPPAQGEIASAFVPAFDGRGVMTIAFRRRF